MNKIISLLTVLFLFTSPCFAEIMQDEFVNSTLKNIPLEKPQTHTKYNYESTKCVPIKLHITENIKNENYIYEGQPVTFKVIEDVVYNNETIIKQGTIVPARVETIIASGMNGSPASIIFGDFKFENTGDRNVYISFDHMYCRNSFTIFLISLKIGKQRYPSLVPLFQRRS